MKWCCPAFEGTFADAGKRGVGIFVDTNNPIPMFVLQFRASDSPINLNHSEPISSVVDVVITYCPWCGVNLGKAYKRNTEELARNDLRIPL